MKKKRVVWNELRDFDKTQITRNIKKGQSHCFFSTFVFGNHIAGTLKLTSATECNSYDGYQFSNQLKVTKFQDNVNIAKDIRE